MLFFSPVPLLYTHALCRLRRYNIIIAKDFYYIIYYFLSVLLLLTRGFGWYLSGEVYNTGGNTQFSDIGLTSQRTRGTLRKEV